MDCPEFVYWKNRKILLPREIGRQKITLSFSSYSCPTAVTLGRGTEQCFVYLIYVPVKYNLTDFLKKSMEEHWKISHHLGKFPSTGLYQ